MERLRLEEWAAAVEVLERIVNQMPAHPGPHDGSKVARAEVVRAAAEAARREREAAEQAQLGTSFDTAPEGTPSREAPGAGI